MTKNNREAQNFVGMSDTMKHYELEKLAIDIAETCIPVEKALDEMLGTTLTIEIDGIESTLQEAILRRAKIVLYTAYTAGLSRGLELLPEEEEKLHEPGWDAGYKHGFNFCRSLASLAIKEEINNTHDK